MLSDLILQFAHSRVSDRPDSAADFFVCLEFAAIPFRPHQSVLEWIMRELDKALPKLEGFLL